MSVEQEALETQKSNRNLDAIFWGGSLLWAGLVFGLDSFGYLPQIGAASSWSWIFFGMGVYGLLLNTIRLFVPGIAIASPWDWVWAIIFLGIGAAGFAAVNVPWWLFLIIIGSVILGTSIIRRQEN